MLQDALKAATPEHLQTDRDTMAFRTLSPELLLFGLFGAIFGLAGLRQRHFRTGRQSSVQMVPTEGSIGCAFQNIVYLLQGQCLLVSANAIVTWALSVGTHPCITAGLQVRWMRGRTSCA